MDKNIRINWLLDFYGPLLTQRQQAVMEMHYSDDMSLAEIAQRLDISKQAVHDAVRRSEIQLEEYESLLGLMAQFTVIKRVLIGMKSKAASGASGIADDIDALLRILEG